MIYFENKTQQPDVPDYRGARYLLVSLPQTVEFVLTHLNAARLGSKTIFNR